MSEKIRVVNTVHGKAYLPYFLPLFAICLPFTVQSKPSWCLLKMQCLNVLRSLPVTLLSSFHGSCGSLALVIISPMRFFFQLDKENHVGQGMFLYLQVRQLVFQEGTLHEELVFHKFSGAS